MNMQSGFELDDLWGIVRRRGKLAVAVAGLVALAAYWVAMALPNEYESYATVLVEPQAIDPTIVKAGIHESDLTERLQIMTAQILSRPRLSRIIDDVSLYPEEQKTMQRQQIIDLMRNRIRVEPVIPELNEGPNTRRGAAGINQFKIYFSDRDPIVARDVAQRLANDFIERHIQQRVETSQKSVDFVESELDRLALRIEEIEARVAAVKAANPGRLPEDMSANQQRMQRLSSELAAAQRNLAVAQSDEAFYRSRVAAAGSVGGGADETSPTRRLELIELALADFKARGYTEKHPDVIKAKVEREQLRKRIQEMETAGEEAKSSQTPSFAQQSAEAEAERAALRRAGAEEEISRLQGMLEDVQAQLGETPAVAEQLDALEREYKHLFGSYQDFSKRRLEATVQAQLERRQLGEQFRVLEAAFEAPEASSPNRPLIVVIGMLFGMVLGGGLAVVLESTDPSVHSARQLQASMQLPVLASIPEIWLDSDRAAQRRRRMREVLVTGGVVVFALVGGYANHAWVNRSSGAGAGAGAGAAEVGPAAAPVAAPGAEPAAPAPAPPAAPED